MGLAFEVPAFGSLTRRLVIAGSAAFALGSSRLAGAADTQDAAMRTVVDGMVRQHGFQGTVMVGRAGRKVFSQAIGLADVEESRSIIVGTHFGIASLSKRLTTVAILRLVEQGRLTLDAPITTCLPWFRVDTGARVTLRRLLSNSSGIPNGYGIAQKTISDFVAPECTTEEAIRRFAWGDLAFDPGSRFDYSATNWYVVQGIIEQTTGQSYPEAMRNLVINPLSLRDTTLSPPATAAKSYRSTMPVEEWPATRRGYQAAAGGYFSNAADLLRFGHLVYNNPFLSSASRSTLTTVEVPSDSYALGGRVRQVAINGANIPAAWDTGNTAGFRTVLGTRLDGKGGVVVLDNHALSQRTMDDFAVALLQTLG